MKKIFAILFAFLMSLGSYAQTYSKSLYDKAATGDTQAMYDLAMCYYEGWGIDKDYSVSAYIMNKAAERGHAMAMNHMGWLYQNGHGVEIDYKNAVYWYKQAALKNDFNGLFNLGWCYYYNVGVEQDYEQAIYWWKKAAEKGNCNAMNSIGSCYLSGNGVDVDGTKVLYWWKMSAAKGNAEGIKNLEQLYRNGYLGIRMDSRKANILMSANNKAKNDDVNGAIDLVYQVFPDLKPKMDSNNPPILQIVSGSVKFADTSGNNAIDANERCTVRFKVKNIGSGSGYDCVARVKTKSYGIGCGEKKIDVIKPGETMDIEIGIKANANISNGTADLAVSVYEPNNFGCDPVTLTVNTKAYVAPMLKIVDYAISSESGGNLRKMSPFNLQMILQNTEYGNAEDVTVNIVLPNNVMLMQGEKVTTFDKMNGGSKKELNYTIIANNAYTASLIPVKVYVKERYGKYAESRTINLAMNREMSAQRIVVDENDNTPKGNIEIAEIEGKIKEADVDKNIPRNAIVNNNTFAVIIANENYQNEEKVDYALNDGRIFKRYCEETLGIPSKNIRMKENATLNNILVNIDWLKNVSESFTDANIIFYYAGHGIPDNQTKDAYLLPVDGAGGNTRTGYKLDELYTELSSMRSKHTIVFLDACFSGAQRDGKMMASARAVAISTRKAAPKGNMVVFSAAQGDETAYPYKEKNHGMFTYFLLKKLQQSRGNISLGDLSAYVITNVQQESILSNEKRQTPNVQSSISLMNTWKDIKL